MKRSLTRLLVVVVAAFILLTPTDSEAQEVCDVWIGCEILCLDWGNLWGPRERETVRCCIYNDGVPECETSWYWGGCC